MEAFIAYEIKAALILCAFYVMYRILLRKETLFGLRRASLLVSSIAAFILPLCTLRIHKTVYVQQAVSTSSDYTSEMVSADAVIPSAESFGFADIIAAIIIAGAAVYLIKTVLQIVQVYRVIKSGKVVGKEDGCRVVVVPGLVSPFSWMRHIVIGDEDCADGNEAVILHEKAHVSKHHTIDVLLIVYAN